MSDLGFKEPTIWAACSDCDTAYALRRSLSWSQGWMWLWAPDCSCGKRKRNPAPPLLMTADGPYVATPDVAQEVFGGDGSDV